MQGVRWETWILSLLSTTAQRHGSTRMPDDATQEVTLARCQVTSSGTMERVTLRPKGTCGWTRARCKEGGAGATMERVRHKFFSALETGVKCYAIYIKNFCHQVLLTDFVMVIMQARACAVQPHLCVARAVLLPVIMHS